MEKWIHIIGPTDAWLFRYINIRTVCLCVCSIFSNSFRIKLKREIMSARTKHTIVCISMYLYSYPNKYACNLFFFEFFFLFIEFERWFCYVQHLYKHIHIGLMMVVMLTLLLFVLFSLLFLSHSFHFISSYLLV